MARESELGRGHPRTAPTGWWNRCQPACSSGGPPFWCTQEPWAPAAKPAPHIAHSSDELLLAKGDIALQACLDRIRAQEAIARANKLNTKAYVDDLKL